MNSGKIEPIIESLSVDDWEMIKVDSIELLHKECDVYDLSVENDMTYLANGFIVHNSVHPFCSCQLMILPDKYEFVKHKVVRVPFTFDEKKYRVGHILTEDEARNLPDEYSQNIEEDAILEYTGKMAVKKSYDNCLIEFDDTECVCRY